MSDIDKILVFLSCLVSLGLLLLILANRRRNRSVKEFESGGRCSQCDHIRNLMGVCPWCSRGSK